MRYFVADRFTVFLAPQLNDEILLLDSGNMFNRFHKQFVLLNNFCLFTYFIDINRLFREAELNKHLE